MTSSPASPATCPHGLTVGSSHLDGIAWAGPVGFCSCHQGHFGYIDSGSWSESGSRTITNDPDLCPDCGGKAVETLTGSGGYDFTPGPGGEEQWYRRTWHTDGEGNVHDEIVPTEGPW